MLSTPMGRYQASLESGLLTPDQHQKEAVELLEKHFQQLISSDFNRVSHEEKSFLNRAKSLFGFGGVEKKGSLHSSVPVKKLGCYIWGGVGRGKTHLMDYFYESLPSNVPAKRTHFHRFMREVHARMHELKDVKNPLQTIGKEYAARYRVLCLDEFVVIDITDAMLLAGLTDTFFQEGLYLITTSNAHPQDLYKDGLQRARFLPTIANLEKYLDIYHLDSQSDFRLRHLKQNPTYSVQNQAGDMEQQISEVYQRYASSHKAESGQIDINNRKIHYKGLNNDVIWFDFKAICGDMRSVADYIEIAQEFHTVIVTDIPQFDVTLESEARRFIHLVDELYDSRVKLVATAAAPIHELYKGTQVVFEFQRTESRLIEMQSEDYLSAARVTRT